MSPLRSLLAGAVVATTLAAAPSASAQQYLPAGSAHLASGVEGGGKIFQRARTRLRIGLELRVDEAPDDAIVVAGLLDIEPRSAFGAELRYVHTLSPRFAIGAGAVAYLVPGMLIGPCAGLEARIPIAKKMSLAVGPETAIFAFGGDLPDGIVVWQALLQVGIRADF